MNHPIKKIAATLAFVYALIVHSGCGSYDVSPQDGGVARRSSGFSMGLSPQGGTVTAGSGMTTGYLQVATGPQAIGNYAGAGPCGAGSAVTAIGSNGAITCGTAGVTNAAGSNVVTKSSGVGSGLVASSITDDGTSITTPETITVNGGAQIASNGNIITGAGTVEGNLVVAGGGNFSTYLGGNGAIGQLGFNYFTAGAATGYINNTSDSGGTSNFRSLEVDDGKGSGGTGGSHYIAFFDGTSRTASFNNTVLGDTSGDTVTVNATATFATDLNMNSHRINNLTNGASAQDAAAFGQIATAVNTGVNGTTNLLARFTGTHVVGNSNVSDDGTTFIVTSGTVFSVNESSGNTFVGGTFTGSGAATINGVLTASGNLISTAGTTTTGNTRGTNITPTLTGGATVNDWAPTGNGTAAHIFVNCPSTVCTITGLVGGADGRELTIYNTGAGEIDIPNASAGSTAGNKFNNSDYGGVVILMANSGCAVQYVYSTADNFWHQTGKACDPVIQQQSTAVTVSVPINLKNTAVNGWVDSTGTMYAGGDTAGAYLSTAGGIGPTLGFGFGTNAAFTGYINMLGYNESTTQPRSLRIQDGQGSAASHSLAFFDGSNNGVTLGSGAATAITMSNQPIGGMGVYGGLHVEQVDEWCGAVTGLATGSSIGTSYQLQFSGTSAGLVSFAHANGHPCELAMSIGLGTSGQGVSVVSQGGFGTSDGNYTWEATVRWPTLSSVSAAIGTEYVSELGFLDTPQNKTQGNGFFFMYDKGNFAGGNNAGNVDALQCVSRESGGGTQTAYLINNTGNSDETFPLGVGTIVANTFYRLKIVVTGTTRAEFYRDTGAGYVKVCDINTHMPTGFGTGFVTMSNASSGTGARSLEVDQSRWAADLTSARSP